MITLCRDDLDFVLIEDYIQPAAVALCHHNGANVVASPHGSLRPDRRRLRIVHPQKSDPHAGLVLLFDHPHQDLLHSNRIQGQPSFVK